MRANCTSEHSSAPLVVFRVFLMMCHDPLWLKFIESFISRHPHVAHVSVSLILFDLSFYFDLSFPVFFLSSVLMYPDLQTDLNYLDSVESNLRDSAKGSLDAYDVTHSLTGYEPNDAVSNELVYSHGPLAYVTPSSDQDIDDTTLGKRLTEAHREYADYLSLEGVFVSQSSLSVASDRTGKPWERATSIRLVLVSETRTVLTISFLQSPKLKKMVDRTGNPWERAVPVHRLGLCLMNRET